MNNNSKIIYNIIFFKDRASARLLNKVTVLVLNKKPNRLFTFV